MKTPEYLFESSWEVCNKVGGIYTVLSTKACTLKKTFGDNLIFIGPDVWKEKQAPDFKQDDQLFSDWREAAAKAGFKVKVGRWLVPGEPPVILVDFKQFMSERDALFFSMWEDFQVDSMHAGLQRLVFTIFKIRLYSTEILRTPSDFPRIIVYRECSSQ